MRVTSTQTGSDQNEFYKSCFESVVLKLLSKSHVISTDEATLRHTFWNLLKTF